MISLSCLMKPWPSLKPILAILLLMMFIYPLVPKACPIGPYFPIVKPPIFASLGSSEGKLGYIIPTQPLAHPMAPLYFQVSSLLIFIVATHEFLEYFSVAEVVSSIPCILMSFLSYPSCTKRIHSISICIYASTSQWCFSRQ